ncbi:hypothetical protein MY11210_002888 [Beauveria gryllotalpidicola]
MEDFRDSRSMTARDSEVDIPLEEKESPLNRVMAQQRQPTTSALRGPLVTLLIVIVDVSNVILGAVVLGKQQRSHNPSGKAHASVGYAHEHPHQQDREKAVPLGGLPHVCEDPDWLPPEDWRTEVFRLHQIYGEEPIGTAKDAWLSMIPKGKGFVVYITYKACWNARAGNFDEIPPEHLVHCWDYLRQSVMCAGDTSLEWTGGVEKPASKAVHAEVIGSAYFSERSTNGIGSEPVLAPLYNLVYISHVATRAVVFIQADEPVGLMCFVGIGVADVSSCEILPKFMTDWPKKIRKGEELGMFHYGGSSQCLLFRRGLKLAFTEGALPGNQARSLAVRSPLALAYT